MSSKIPMSHILIIIVAWDMEAEKQIKERCLMFLKVSTALPPTGLDLDQISLISTSVSSNPTKLHDIELQQVHQQLLFQKDMSIFI